jgi:hypothetical protein
MRIKSSFRDYYDKCQFFGTDDQLYVRNLKEVTDVPLMYSCDSRWSPTYGYRKITIGFCGKVYMGYQFYNPSKLGDYSKFLYASEDIKDYYGYKGWEWPKSSFYNKSYEEKYDIISKLDLSEWFRKYHTPIMICDTSKSGVRGIGKLRRYYTENITTINGCLQNYNFQTVFDPQQTYQEISMFLGNMASPEKPIPKISDEIMLEAKGFNKYSFRKDKTNK